MKKSVPIVLLMGLLLMVCFIPMSDADPEPEVLIVDGVDMIANPGSDSDPCYY